MQSMSLSDVVSILSLIASVAVAIVIPIVIYNFESKVKEVESYYEIMEKKIGHSNLGKYGEFIKGLLLETVFNNLQFKNNSLNKQFKNELYYDNFKRDKDFCWFQEVGGVIYFNKSTYQNSIKALDNSLREMNGLYLDCWVQLSYLRRKGRKIVLGNEYKYNKKLKKSKVILKMAGIGLITEQKRAYKVASIKKNNLIDDVLLDEQSIKKAGKALKENAKAFSDWNEDRIP